MRCAITNGQPAARGSGEGPNLLLVILLAVLLAAPLLLISLAKAKASTLPQCGSAAWYEFTSRTASGEPGNPESFAAAHPWLPFGTRVRVENLANGRSVVVRINDRGPHGDERIIDLTRAAAEQLGMIAAGTARVRVTTPENASAGSCR